MGGASVAVADDGTALWTNPAGLALRDGLDVEIFGGGVATNRNEFTAAVDRLASIDLDAIARGEDLDRIPGALRDLFRLAEPGTGVVGSGVAGVAVGKGAFAIGIGDEAYGAVFPTIDLERILPVNDPDIGFAFNETAATLVGLEAREARAGYAVSLLHRVLLVGAAVRYVQGRTYFSRTSIFDTEDSDPVDLVRKAFDENARQSDAFTFDVGAMVNILGKARVGVAAHALNEPDFDVARVAGAPGSVRLPRTVRAGVAVTPIGLLMIAADYDLIESATLRPGGDSRQFSAGLELKLPLFALRAGAFRDSAAPDPHWAYSAGLGLGLKALSLNAAVVFSTEGGFSVSSTNRRDLGAAVDARLRF